MSSIKNEYQFYSNSLNNDLFKANVIDIDEGFIGIFVLLKGPCTACCKLVDFIHSKFEQYFKYQQYTNPRLIISESIPHVGRQIYLQATHDESFFGIHASCMLTYYRDKEMLVAQVGDLDIKQLVLSNKSSEYELINTHQQAHAIDFLMIDNFHEITPFVFQFIPAEGDVFVISESTFFENSTERSKLLSIAPAIANNKAIEEPLKPMIFPMLCIKILKTKIIKHSNDDSIVKQVTSLSYFKNIPKIHLYVLMALVISLSLLIFLVRPQDYIGQKEREIFIASEQFVQKEVGHVKYMLDSTVKEKSKTEALKDTVIEPEFVMRHSNIIDRDTFAVYVVEHEETLFRISKSFNVPISEIASINGIVDNKIKTGQKIKIPVQAYHLVENNETLYEIADRFQTSVTQLMYCNKIQEPVIQSGRMLIIPMENEK